MKRSLTSPPVDPAAPWADAAKAAGIHIEESALSLARSIMTAYPGLRAQVVARPGDVTVLARGRLRVARDLRAYRRLASSAIGDVSNLEDVRRGLRLFAQRERLRIAARELLAQEAGDVDVTARELSDLAQVSIEIALTEAQRWAEARFGIPTTGTGARCAITMLGMGKLGGRELNGGSDVDLLPFYETDDGAVLKDGLPTEQSLHEHFTRVVQRMTATLDDVTEEGQCWRVDLRLRPEGARGPLVNSLAAAERYYETWGRTWERAALVRARPIAGQPAFGAKVIEALSPFVWRKAIDPRIALEMAQLVQRARIELSGDPERDIKLGVGGIREAEFFVQSLQLIWGGREPSLRPTNTLEALRRLRARGFVTDRESREVEASYLSLRRIEHRVQFASGIQTHQLPHGELLETIARSLGHHSGRELERELERTRRRVASRLASLLRGAGGADGAGGQGDLRFASLLVALDHGDEAAVLAALAEEGAGFDVPAPSLADLARHIVALAKRPDLPLGASARDKFPDLAVTLLEAIEGAADPEQAARLLVALCSRLKTPSVYVRAMAEDTHALRRLVGLLGASAFLGEALVSRPDLVDNVLFAKGIPTSEGARRELETEVSDARARVSDDPEFDPHDEFVGALRRAKARVTMEIGLAELAGELTLREAALVLSELADATLAQATARALEERGLEGGLAVIGMGKLGGREIGYGSDLDIFFVYDARGRDDELAERYIRAAQRVLSFVSTPHGAGPGYDLDTRLRPSGSHGLLVVSVEAFARYHGVVRDGVPLANGATERHHAADWERQALLKARACAGDQELGRRVVAIAERVAYERGAAPPEALHHLRMRMERELGKEGPNRYDVKLGTGGLVDVEFAVQWLQMKHGLDLRVRSTDTETALSALEAAGHCEASIAASLREGYAFLRRLEQALRIVHGTSASLIEHGAPGLAALARRMGFRDGAHGPNHTAGESLLERYKGVRRDVRVAYLVALGLEMRPSDEGSTHRLG